MPFESHPIFDAPADESSRLWRYMSLAKLVSLLSKKALFFSRADMLGDPLEGSVGAENLRLRPEWYGEHFEMITKSRAAFSMGLPQCTAVNCWHVSEYESSALWPIYGGESGVAIRSTYQRLTESLGGENKIFVGVVRYVDYDREAIPEGNTLSPFLHKRRSYEHERELRAVIQEFTAVGEGSIAAVSKWERGLYVPVDTDRLVDRIAVAPVSPAWYVDAVKAVVEAFGPSVPVERSDLDREAIY